MGHLQMTHRITEMSMKYFTETATVGSLWSFSYFVHLIFSTFHTEFIK